MCGGDRRFSLVIVPRWHGYEPAERRPVFWKQPGGNVVEVNNGQADPYTQDGIPMFKRALRKLAAIFSESERPNESSYALGHARRGGNYGYTPGAWLAVKHCRAIPAHEVRGRDLDAVLYLRGRLTKEQWSDHSPTPATWNGYRAGDTSEVEVVT